ncbi:hypothetical protein [Streptomyces murinus]|uniref:hypothetical protein n=1 Tax=Streptomyces murinus TaxID=33900 RepID=UPI003812FFCD
MRSGLLRAVRLLVVRVHRAHYVGIGLCDVAVRADAGVVGHLGGHLLEAAQSVGREIEGFHVRAGFPQGPQRRHVDRLLAARLLLLVVVLGFGGQGREQLLGHCRLLVGDDVVRPAPHGGSAGGAQLLAHHHAGQDGAFVLMRGISHSPASWPGGQCAGGSPGSAGDCRSGSGSGAGGRRRPERSDRAHWAV